PHSDTTTVVEPPAPSVVRLVAACTAERCDVALADLTALPAWRAVEVRALADVRRRVPGRLLPARRYARLSEALRAQLGEDAWRDLASPLIDHHEHQADALAH